MQRILLAIGGAAAFCAAVTFLLQIAIARGIPASDIVLVTASATLLLSLGAAVLAYRAFNRANLVANELERLTRSMDAAIKDVSLRGDREAAKLEELNTVVSSRLAEPSRRKQSAADDIASDEDASYPEAPSRQTSSRQGKQAATASADVGETADIDAAIRRIIAAGQAELSLQPIIAPGRGEAGGFEVHLHVQPEEGKPVDVRRLDRQIADVHPAAFERLAMVSATEAIRRRLGDASETKPLHVAISTALLSDDLEFTTVLDIFKLHPAFARSIVASLPTETLESGRHSSALAGLSGVGIRLAAEGWTGSQEGLDASKEAGATMIKIVAATLLDRVKVRKVTPNGAMMMEMADQARVNVIATEVQSEEDAVSLIDMGVDLLTGELLSPPRRLEAQTVIGRRA